MISGQPIIDLYNRLKKDDQNIVDKVIVQLYYQSERIEELERLIAKNKNSVQE